MKQDKAKKYGMVIDLDKCTGCGSCMVACMAENNVPFREDETDKLLSISWMRVYKLTNGKHFPDGDECFLPRPCMHCGGKGDHGHSPCVSVCPATATDYSLETGIVSQIYARCIGCRYCANACPYLAKSFNWRAPHYPEESIDGLNPEVSTRPVGVVEKCTFCHHRLQNAREQARMENRPMREGDYVPACAESCPTGAITFGDLENKRHSVAKLAADPRAFRLHEDLGTEPKVFYLPEEG